MGSFYTCNMCGEKTVLRSYDCITNQDRYTCHNCGVTEYFKHVENAEDNVNHPKHYTKGKYECLDVIKDICKDLAGVEAFLVANIIKYIWRFNTKNGLEDLKKARFYLDELIQKKEE